MGFQCSRVCTETTSSDSNLLSIDADVEQNQKQSTVFVWVFGATGFARHLRRLTAIKYIFVLFYYAFINVSETL